VAHKVAVRINGDIVYFFILVLFCRGALSKLGLVVGGNASTLACDGFCIMEFDDYLSSDLVCPLSRAVCLLIVCLHVKTLNSFQKKIFNSF